MAPPLSRAAIGIGLTLACAPCAVSGRHVVLAAQAAATAGPRAVVDTTAHDFGVVGFGTEPAAAISIRNTGTTPLEIGVASPPRGLRLVSLDRTIAPGASGAVRLTVDTFQAAPKNDWRLEIATNDPEQRNVEVTVKAEVRAFLAMEPPSARFAFVQYGKEGGTTHLLAAVDDPKLQVKSVESPFGYVKATFRELKASERSEELPPGRQWRIDLTIAELAPVGPIGGYVVVHTTHAKQPRAFLPVTGFVRPLFAVTPPSVDLREVKPSETPGDAPLRTLIVKNFGAEPIALMRASSDVPGLDARIVEVEVGHTWRVELRLTDAASAPVAAGQAAAGQGGAGQAAAGQVRGTGPAAGPFKGTLRLATASRRVPELTVPIQGIRIAAPAPQ